MNISLCMIVKNEEEMLEESLKSAQNYVDEIIIVDTGSEDRTIDIAKKFNAKVISFVEEKFSFGRARNVAINNATSEWILFLDADERIELKGIKTIKELIKEKTFHVCNLWRYNYCPGGGWSGYYMWKLFKNDKFMFIGDMLETPVWEGISTPVEIESSDIIIHHMGRFKEEVFSKKKNERYIEAVKELINDSNITPELSLYYNMTLSLMYCQNNEKNLAIDKLNECKEKKEFEGWLYHRLAGDIYRFCSKYSLALKEYQIAVELTKDNQIRSLLYEIIGLIYVEVGKYEEAFEKIKDAFYNDNSMAHRYINLGVMYVLLGVKEKGKELIRQGMKKNSYFLNSKLYSEEEPKTVMWDCDTPKIFKKVLNKYILENEV